MTLSTHYLTWLNTPDPAHAASGWPRGNAPQLTHALLCLHSYGLIKVDLQEAELDVADQYTASVAIGEQVPQYAPLTPVNSCTKCRAACESLRSLRTTLWHCARLS
jgi:hypothetical protein